MIGPVDGTTLVIQEEIGGGDVVCVCITCGKQDVYDKKYLVEHKQECRTCKEIKRRLSTDTQKVQFLMQQEISTTRTTKGLKEGTQYIDTRNSIQAIPIGKTLRVTVDGQEHIQQIIGYIGVYGKNGNKKTPTSVVFKCINCGNILIKEMKGVLHTSGMACLICRDTHSESIARVREAKREANDKIKDQAKRKEESAQKAAVVEEQRQALKMHKQEEMDKMRGEKAYNQQLDKIKAANPGYFVIDRLNGDKLEVKLICAKCGTIAKISEYHNRHSVGKCQGCETLQDNPYYKGVYGRDYVDKIFNRLVVVNQYPSEKGYLCDVQCVGCSKPYKGVYLYDVINRQIHCDCDKADVSYDCPKCGAPTYTPIRKIQDGCVCSRCGYEISAKLLKDEAVYEEVKWSFARRARALESKLNYKITEPLSEQQIVKETIALYAGTDGREYFRCACIQHNLQLILSDVEIDNFDHSQCVDTRQHLLRDVEAERIKLD